MKVVIHHLPTGCSWNVTAPDTDEGPFIFNLMETLDKGKATWLSDENKTLCFPPKVLSESVVRIEE